MKYKNLLIVCLIISLFYIQLNPNVQVQSNDTETELIIYTETYYYCDDCYYEFAKFDFNGTLQDEMIQEGWKVNILSFGFNTTTDNYIITSNYNGNGYLVLSFEIDIDYNFHYSALNYNGTNSYYITLSLQRPTII